MADEYPPLTFVEAERLIQLLRRRQLEYFSEMAGLRDQIQQMEQSLALCSGTGVDPKEGPARILYCFGWNDAGDPYRVEITYDEMQALQRVARAQLEWEAKRLKPLDCFEETGR